MHLFTFIPEIDKRYDSRADNKMPDKRVNSLNEYVAVSDFNFYSTVTVFNPCKYGNKE